MRLAAAVLLLFLGCKSREAAPAAAAAADAAPVFHTARAAVRCRECHGEIAEQWRDSAHAHSADSPIYLAMRGNDDHCDRCHAPLKGLVAPSLPVVGEGVTCDVCHTIPRVTLEAAGAAFAMELDANVKYGPLCDPTPHYFHHSTCTPLFKESTFCAACHRWSPSPHVPVFTEYDEWAQSGQAMQCQGCHMPGLATSVATGFHPRDSVPHHGFLGRAHELRARAVSGGAAFSLSERTLHAEVELANDAGHAVPAGLPGRELVLRVRILDGEGKELAAAEKIYHRLLVDAAGEEAPFTTATAQKEDNRLLPDKSVTESFDLTAPLEAAAVEVLVEWRALSPALARKLAVAAPVEPVLRASAAFGKLPAKLTLQAIRPR